MNGNNNFNNSDPFNQFCSNLVLNRFSDLLFNPTQAQNPGYTNSGRQAQGYNNSQQYPNGPGPSNQTLANRARRKRQKGNKPNGTTGSDPSGSKDNRIQQLEQQVKQLKQSKQQRQQQNQPSNRNSNQSIPTKISSTIGSPDGLDSQVLKDSHEYINSVLFPELGNPLCLPGMGLACNGRYTTSFNITPTAAGTAFAIIQPMNFNSVGRLIWTLSGAYSAAFADWGGIASPYQDGTIVEKARVTASSMRVRCVNPTNQGASGIVAASYQAKRCNTALAWTENTTQRDIEQAVTKSNGTLCGLSQEARAVWLPLDSNDLAYRESGRASDATNFFGLAISNSNANTTFRVDLTILYEYTPGPLMEDVSLETQAVKYDAAHQMTVYSNAASVISSTGTNFTHDDKKHKSKLLKSVLYLAGKLSGLPGVIASGLDIADDMTGGKLSDKARQTLMSIIGMGNAKTV